MDKHIATLEELRSFHKDFAFANIEEASRIIPALDAAIALMRGQSERPRAYYCPLDTGPGMLMHNDETAEKMIAYFAPKGQVFIPLFEGQPLPPPAQGHSR